MLLIINYHSNATTKKKFCLFREKENFVRKVLDFFFNFSLKHSNDGVSLFTSCQQLIPYCVTSKSNYKTCHSLIQNTYSKTAIKNIVGYMWSLNETSYANVLGIVLVLAWNKTKIYCTVLIWYTFKMFNCFISSINEFHVFFTNIILATCFCFPKIPFRYVFHALLAQLTYD